MHTGLTIKELGWIEEGLRLETLTLKLSGIQAQSVSDPQMKQFFGRCQQQAQQRIQQFSGVLASAASQGQSQGQGQFAGQVGAWQGGPH